jgi:prepilin-type N-terminal cleavage/methylation domain-containing protein
MRLSHTRRSGRPSFTLVELLIVLAIISVLLSLISASVWKAISAANRTRNRSEVAQLAVGVENFKSRYGFYPPSRFHLAETLSAYNANSPLDADSLQVLTKMFPNLTSPGGAWSSPNGVVNWGGRKPSDPPVNAILEGDQCLVFFLGGVPDNFSGSTNCTGFSTNPLDPSWHITHGGDVQAPFYEFVSSQLVRSNGLGFAKPSNLGFPRDGRFYSYLDTYLQRPYAYFSSGKSRNDYNRYFIPTGTPPAAYQHSDCRSLLTDPSVALPPSNPLFDHATVWPYAEAPGTAGLLTPSSLRYLNPSSFQIISAGADGIFGTGTVLTRALANNAVGAAPYFPPNASVVGYASGAPGGYDDQSNFRESTIGTGN